MEKSQNKTSQKDKKKDGRKIRREEQEDFDQWRIISYYVCSKPKTIN